MKLKVEDDVEKSKLKLSDLESRFFGSRNIRIQADVG
jgi:hypothetical protein